VRREEFDPRELEREKAIYEAQARESGKPAAVAEKMVLGRIEKLYKESVLLEQEFIKDSKMTVEDRVKAAISKLGENMTVRRFARFQLGE
jgi:elongation factor Ts